MTHADDKPVPRSAPAESQRNPNEPTASSPPPAGSSAPDVSPAVDPAPVEKKLAVRKPKRKGWTRRAHYKVDDLLRPDEREAYEQLLHDPRTLNRQLHAWLLARGHRVSLGSVGNHRKQFQRDIKGVRDAARMANTFAGLVRANGAAVMTEASQARYEQLFMQNLFDTARETGFTPKDWTEMGRAMAGIVSARREVEQMREESKRRAAETLRAIREAEQQGEECDDLVTRVERILEGKH